MVNTKRLIRERSMKKDRTTYTRPEGAGNFDNMDDKNIVDQINVKIGTCDIAPTLDKHIVNKKYVDDEISGIPLTNPAGNTGEIQFNDAGSFGADSDLFWDNVNKRLGIGTNSPGKTMQINGSVQVGNSDGSSGESGLTIYGDSANKYIQLYNGGSYAALAITTANFQFYNAATGGFIQFRVKKASVNTLAMHITNDCDVGIGTGTPDTKLQVVGDVKIGQDTTNYASFASDGELTLTGNARVTDCVWIGANGIKAPGSNPASFVEDGLTGCWEFADAIEANQENISGTLKIPCSMDRSVVPIFNIGWHANGVSPGNAEWQLEYLWVSPDEDASGAAQETLTATSTASATSDGLVVAAFSGIDLPSSTDVAMMWRVTRLSAHANDTISAVVHVRGNFMKFTKNKLGTGL